MIYEKQSKRKIEMNLIVSNSSVMMIFGALS